MSQSKLAPQSTDATRATAGSMRSKRAADPFTYAIIQEAIGAAADETFDVG